LTTHPTPCYTYNIKLKKEANVMYKIIIGAILFAILNLTLENVFKLQSHQWYAVVSYSLGVFIGVWLDERI